MQNDVHFDADFIIVGAGSAGSLLADRLSADGRHTVLLLEAGGPDSYPWLRIPIGYAKTFVNPRYNWMYQTEPEPELKNRSIYWPRGKVLGGSGAINGLVYIRGDRRDYDDWQVPGWSFDELLPFFKRHEDYHGGASAWHGAGGEISVAKPVDRPELCEMIIASAEAAGLKRNDDFNGPDQDGVGYYDLTTRNGFRSSSGSEMLRRAKSRPNLRILTHTQATRLLFSTDGRRVVGVEAVRDGNVVRCNARRETILTLGAINTPQLLMVSGIGPAPALRHQGIDVRLDSAGIGQNLQDHLQCRMVLRANRKITQNDVLRSLWGKLGIGLDYVVRRRGLMTFAAGQVGAFFRSRPELERVDGQLLQFSFSAPKTGEPLHPFSGFTTTVSQLRPESRGEITLASADMRQAPKIAANYLSTQTDRDFYVDALGVARSIFAQEPMASELHSEYWPGPQVSTRDEMLDYVRGMASTIFHPCGTVRMGGDEEAPLSPDLSLRGVDGLRVADASAIPTIVSGNINAPTLMIAERAAAMVLADTARRQD